MDSRIKAVMCDSAQELVAGRMREYCEGKGIRINSRLRSTTVSRGPIERLVGVATNGTCAMLRDSNLLPHFWAEAMTTLMYLRNRTPTRANGGITPYERFSGWGTRMYLWVHSACYPRHYGLPDGIHMRAVIACGFHVWE